MGPPKQDLYNNASGHGSANGGKFHKAPPQGEELHEIKDCQGGENQFSSGMSSW